MGTSSSKKEKKTDITNQTQQPTQQNTQQATQQATQQTQQRTQQHKVKVQFPLSSLPLEIQYKIIESLDSTRSTASVSSTCTLYRDHFNKIGLTLYFAEVCFVVVVVVNLLVVVIAIVLMFGV